MQTDASVVVVVPLVFSDVSPEPLGDENPEHVGDHEGHGDAGQETRPGFQPPSQLLLASVGVFRSGDPVPALVGDRLEVVDVVI